MKKILTVVVLVLFAAAAVNAQEFKQFRVGIGAGYAKAGGSGGGGGLMFAIEPGYRVNDQILANFRWESAAVIRGTVDDTGADLDVAAIGSYTLNGQYFFSNNNFRPFVGVGFGMFSLAAVTIESSGTGGGGAASAETKFGFYPRFGFDASHFTFCIDYNFIPNTSTTVGSDTYEFKNSYIGFRLGGYFGGGRK